MQSLKRILITCFLLLVVLESYSQEAGRPFIRNFTPKEYGASQQNWSIAQDQRGIMYFANNDGLLEFDGVSWKLVSLPGLRSVVIDTMGRIYAGMENDMGYLEPDSRGNLKFYSLKDKIPGGPADITTVYSMHKMGDQIIFQTDDNIYLYRDEKMKILQSKESFLFGYVVHDRFYAMEMKSGLYYLNNDSLVFIKGSDFFTGEKISFMLPYGTNQVLIGTRNKGLYIYSPDGPEVFYKPAYFKEVDDFLVRNQSYCGTVLTGGDFAIGSITEGIIVFDTLGRIKDKYYKNAGLQDNTVLSLYSDQSGQLWTALDIGISLIQNNLPFRNYTDLDGLFGSPLCLKYFRDRFYVGTGQYLHIQNRKGVFETIEGTESQNFILFEANGILLLGCTSGIFEIKDRQAIPLENTSALAILSIVPLKNHPGYFLAGEGNGLFLLEYRNSKWKLNHRIKGFEKAAYDICVDENENIWVSTTIELLRLKINAESDSVILMQKGADIKGFPSNYGWPFALNSGEVVFGSGKGIYRYIDQKELFEPHPDFNMIKGKVLPFSQVKNGDIWFDEEMETGHHERGVLMYRNGKYLMYKTPFYKFTDLESGESPHNVCQAPDSTIFYGTSSGLIQYNPKLKFNTASSFQTLIRKVYCKDSLLFGGGQKLNSDFAKNNNYEIAYKQNDMTFHFAAAYYEDSEKNLYSYRLVGADTSWSEWVRDNKKEYTNLPEGKYRFEVKSKNQYQMVGVTASYSFHIKPPWYREWWAYGLYVILLVTLIWIIVKYNIRRLVKQKDQLQKIVEERTAEVLEQKIEIEAAYGQITDSIQYAQIIQQAVLPASDIIQQSFPEHFVLFKPRNVVSGDFYWYAKVENQIVITVADCTGHGVPGAFMSMLGMSLLKEIVLKEYMTQPDIILRRLRKEIIRSLGQSGKFGEAKDGMDISLCSINLETMEMKWSGAYNPCWIIKEGKLIKLEPDKMPIGISFRMEKFTLHEIKLQKGWIIYLASDGFTDQFGGPLNKKFMVNRFKELLLTISEKPMVEQKEILDITIEQWMGSGNRKREQTDDITVMGIKI
ncbi:MAG: SpoIIE family protein phosphatase [Bacteroidia bacterium]|nr:SpoIIE family protein phosphatase [Bacteroidia bacterium]